MATTADMMNTIELINNFWPDLQCSKQDFVPGNPEFIVRFYSNFIAEVNDIISYLINEEIISEFDDIQDFDKEVILYCKVAKLFKKIKYFASLNLADFYCPKKMYPYVKFSIHFVVYINNCLDEIFNLLNENFKTVTETENFKVLKEQHLQDSAENAENVARLQDIFNTLTTKLEECKKHHEKMLEEKIIEKNIYSEKTLERDTLQSEMDNLEYELKLLQDKEEDLKECIITERDYENLRNTEKRLEIEQQRLCSDNLGTDDIDTEIESVKQLEECAKKLACLRLDSLDVYTLHDLREQLASTKNKQTKLNNDLIDLNETTNTRVNNIENLKLTLEKTQLCSASLKKKSVSAEQDEAKCFESETAKYVANFEKSQRLQTEIIFREEEIKGIEEGERKLSAVVAQEYQKILNTEKKTTNKFYNTLVKMKKDGEGAV